MDMLLECGLADLGWRELEAWQSLTGTPINSWEAQAMIATSKAYSSAVAEFTDNNERAPYQPLDFDRDKVADQVRGALRKRR